MSSPEEERIAPNKRWETFFKKIQAFSQLPTPQWKPMHLLGYFCSRYAQHFGHPFAFTFNTAPSKCPELFLLKKISAALNTEAPSIIKSYIDWVFDKQIIPQKRQVRSLGYLVSPSFANTFLQESKPKITRASPVPSEFQSFAEFHQVELSTYNDLVMIYLALQEDSTSEARQPYKRLLEQLFKVGLSEKTIQTLSAVD